MGWLRRSGAWIAFGLVIGTTVVLGCAASLRPPTLAPVPDVAARSAGGTQIAALGRAHGLERWQRFSRARFRLDDESMPSCLRGGAVPFRSASQRLDVSLTLRDTTVRAGFVDGPRSGETVGLKGQLAYQVNDDATLAYAENSCVQEYLRSLQRSFLLPLSLAARAEAGEASAFSAGERTLDGRSYDLVYLTMPASYGTRGRDEEYVLWTERSSGRVEWIELTDRRRSRRARGVLRYTEYRDVGGVQVPGRIERIGSVGDLEAERRLELSEIALD